MEDFELTLYDRLEAIKSTNKKYDLENNAYISFSGGKDSCVVSKLIDIALPNNKIPRVYFNTGIEYALMVKFVKELVEKDNRIVIVNSNVNIKKMLETKGYPFKSKEFSLKLKMYRNNSKSKYIKKFIARGYYASCPDKLRFTLQPDFTLNISDLCCYELKKKIAMKYEKDSIRPIAILGLMQNEGGERKNHTGCVIFDSKDKNKITKFKPLNPVSHEFEKWFIEKYQVKLCSLYYEPYNFTRTGCRGCPYAIDLQQELDIMEKYLPSEYKACNSLWKPVYDIYREHNYRLRSQKQLAIDDFIKDIK